MSVLIGMPSGSGLIPSPVMQSLLQLRKPTQCAFMIIERQRIDKARNAIAMACLEQKFDYLLFVDDDNPIPADTLEILLADNKDIVSTPIPARNADADGNHMLCSFYKREVEVDGKPFRFYEPIKEFKDEAPLHRVDATGTGCVLIKRKVLEVLNEKYQDYMFEFGDLKLEKPIEIDGRIIERRTMSEDAEFSERAVDAGFEIWLDERIRPLHLTQQGSVQWPIGT